MQAPVPERVDKHRGPGNDRVLCREQRESHQVAWFITLLTGRPAGCICSARTIKEFAGAE